MSSSQLPKGYKQTEVGVIPENWKVLKLNNIAPLQRGFDLPTAKLKEGDYPVVYSNGAMNYHSKFMVNGPGVVTGRSGTIGNVHYISENYWPHNTALWVTDFINSYPQYIYYLYKFIKLERFGTGSSVPTLNRNDVHDLTVAIPRPEEQRAIAQALSDVDALIASLDKLIAKKRHLKTATMQQLLTGKKRLPGFGEGKGYKQTEVGVIPEDWDVQYLKSTLKNNPQYGINAAAVPYRDSLPIYIRITDISEAGYFSPETLVSVNKENSDQYYLENGDLVFARTGASVGKSYLYDPNDGELVFAGFLIRIRPDENILLPIYLSQYVKTKTYWNWVQLMSMRSGQPGINGNEYGQMLVPFPEIEEQRAIAAVLSDMDTDIAALEARRAKTQAIKQGMMQELLTGRTRLV